MTFTLTIGTSQNPRTRWFQKQEPQKPTQVDLTLDNPHLLILGVAGIGKTVMCEYITAVNRGPFVFLGRDFRENKAGRGRQFYEVPDENFFTYDSGVVYNTAEKEEQASSLAECLDAAANRALELKATLIIDEISFCLGLDREHFFQVIENLTEAGVHIIFTAQGIYDKAAYRRLRPGNLVLLGHQSAGGVNLFLEQAYPELKQYLRLSDKRGEFVLRTPKAVSAWNTVPAPWKL